MPYVKNDGIHIYYEVEGSGFPLMLHAGIASGGTIWRDAGYVEGLGEYQCVLIDQRGRGRSDKPRTLAEHHADKYASDIVMIMDELELERCAFYGQSAGASIGTYLTAHYPDRVAALILATELPPPEQVLASDGREIHRRQAERAATYYREVDSAGRRGKEAMVARFEEAEGLRYPVWLSRVLLEADFEMVALETLGREEPWDLLPQISTPTFLIAGGRGDPDNNNERWAEMMPNAHSIALPDLGHIGAWLQSDLVLPHVNAFLRETLASE